MRDSRSCTIFTSPKTRNVGPDSAPAATPTQRLASLERQRSVKSILTDSEAAGPERGLDCPRPESGMDLPEH